MKTSSQTIGFKHTACFVILFLFTFNFSAIVKADNSVAASGVISGKVKDKATEIPIEYSSVMLYKLADSSYITGVITDTTGGFVLNKVPEGKYFIKVNFIGYKQKIIENIEVSASKKEIILDQILLENSSNNLNEVNIVSEKNAVEFKIDKKVINMSQQAGAEGGTVADALQNTPSVQIDADGNVLLRGSANYTLLINGKPTPLSPTEVLKNTPASSIENIEIITNPSAKYDAEGISGIINLIMKKQSTKDLTGNATMSLGTGNKYMGNIMLSFKKKKTNFYAGADYSDLANNSDNENERIASINSETDILKSTGDRVFTNKNIYFIAGCDYDLNDMNTFGISLNAGEYQFWRDMDGKYHEYNEPLTFNEYTFATDKKRIKGKYINASASYTHWFGSSDHELKAEFYSNFWDGSDNTTTKSFKTDELYTISDNVIMGTVLHEDNLAQEYRGKVDYKKTFKNKNVFEAGSQAIVKPAYFNYEFNIFDPLVNDMVYDSTGSSEMNYDDNVYAAYAQYSGSFKKFDYQLGFRSEYTDRKIEILKTGENFIIQRPDYFPSAYISRAFGETNQLQLSYSKRINRPEDWNMVPYALYSDSYSKMYGNPGLKPELINAYEFNYLKSLKNYSSLSLGLYYRDTKDPMGRVMSVDSTGIVIVKFENTGWNRAAGAELSVTLLPKKWINLTIAGNLYYFAVSSEQGYTGDNSGTNYDINISPVFKFNKNTKLSLNLIYNSASVTSQGSIDPFYVVNATFKRDLMKQKLTLSLSARNLLKSMKYTINNYGEGFTNTMKIYGEGPVITMGLSYKLNNYKPVKRVENSGGQGMGM